MLGQCRNVLFLRQCQYCLHHVHCFLLLPLQEYHSLFLQFKDFSLDLLQIGADSRLFLIVILLCAADPDTFQQKHGDGHTLLNYFLYFNNIIIIIIIIGVSHKFVLFSLKVTECTPCTPCNSSANRYSSYTFCTMCTVFSRTAFCRPRKRCSPRMSFKATHVLEYESYCFYNHGNDFSLHILSISI